MIGPATMSETRSACWSVNDFGTISPITTWKKLRMTNAAMTEMVVATPVCQLRGKRSSAEPRMSDTTGSPMAPSARLESVTPSWIAEMKRGGLSTSAQHAGRGTAALGLQLLEAGAANRDKRVLGGDEESVRRDNQRHRHELEGGCHHVLGTSSLKRA